jgi:hypothetical protein
VKPRAMGECRSDYRRKGRRLRLEVCLGGVDGVHQIHHSVLLSSFISTSIMTSASSLQAFNSTFNNVTGDQLNISGNATVTVNHPGQLELMQHSCLAIWPC